ncbi:UDP-glycosyltransferase UGT5-like [Zerene cesonia]|uniref:UDP-glycosyltransferase UGT5-like n=1 Tax=Zerene cesonia TaxID=33412 RepID=UPI0018E55FBE|nr:UDP-glycosyltransferase UGT5-like [Zerene cesonia]
MSSVLLHAIPELAIMLLKICAFLFYLTIYSEAANILYVIPFTTKSHYITLRPIGLELARRGHNVTVITAHKENEHPPNYHQVMVKATKIWEALGGKPPNVFSTVDLSAVKFHNNVIWPGGLALTEEALQTPAVQELLSSDAKFDLVISEQFFQEAFYGLAYKYNAPLALVTTFGNCMRHNFVTRNPLQLATVPSELLDVQEPTSFSGRLKNFYFTVYELFWWKFWYLEKQEHLMKKYIPGLREPIPSLYEIQKNTSLMLVNSHFSVDSPMPYLPNIVEIGGVHITKSNSSLPKDLQKYLDDADDGFVYVNFGSNVRSIELPEEKKQAFLKVFKRLKRTVVWKWEDDNLDQKPDNVIVRKWLPQKEILAHPNIRVFVSHGGLIGTQEALYNGVPIIGVPIYGDQYNNILALEEMGYGKLLQYNDITEERMYGIIAEVLNNESFTKTAKEVSRRFWDRPMNALDTAMYWIEYIIRNNGAPYMKSQAIELSWLSFSMLDVYIFIGFLVVSSIIFTIKVIKIINTVLCSRKTIDKKKKT